MSETALSSDKGLVEEADAFAAAPSPAVIDAVADAQALAATDAAGQATAGEPEIGNQSGEPQVVVTVSEPDEPAVAVSDTAQQGSLAASGWFAAEPDGVIRGWVMDRNRPGYRFTVAVMIDGESQGTVRADRPHHKLIEMGEGDGHYAFAFAIPLKFRDGQTHSLAAELLDKDYEGRRMKIREPEFSVSPDLPIPRFLLRKVGVDALEGVMVNARPQWNGELDVWVDGRRQSADAVTVDDLGRDNARANMRIRLGNHRPLELLSRSVVVSYPGVQDAIPEESTIQSLFKADIRPEGESRFTLTLDPGVSIPDGHGMRAILSDEFGQKLDESPVRFVQNAIEFHVPEDSPSDLLQLSLTTPDGNVIAQGLNFSVNSTGRLLGNGSFDAWTASGPNDWLAMDGLAPERGYYAFPPAMKQQHGLSGKTALFHLKPGSGEQVLLRQPLRRTSRLGISPVELALGFMGRASRQIELELRLTNAQGEVVTGTRFVAGSRWKLGVRPLTLSRPGAKPSPLTFEVVARMLSEEDDGFVELAGLRCGDIDEAGFDMVAERAPAAPMRRDINLLANPDLQSWPNGLSMLDRRSRFELADNWFVFNRKSPVAIRASAIAIAGIAGGEPRYGLSLDVSQVPEYCRLEIALDVNELYGSARLEFTASCREIGEDPASRFLFDKKWGQIDKIYILKRETVSAGQKVAQVDTTVASVARRVLVSREWERQGFNFTLDAVEQGGEFEPATIEEKLIEYFLIFEFRRPLQISFHSVDLRLVKSAEAASAPSAIQLEDANIRSQVATIKGLEHWIAPTVSRPAVMRAPNAGAAKEPQRWNRSHSARGTVDVGICVYNATEETLDCLASLVGSSTVPHMVRIINDGSGEDCRQRILQFIADKPWMQLIDNDGNRGYTTSANRAILESDADWVILLNSDTIVSPGWIEGLLEVAATDPAIAFVGPMSNAATFQSVPELYDGGGKWAINDLPEGWTPADVAAMVAQKSQRAFPEVPLLNGFCTLIRRSVFAELGGLNEKAFPAGYGEENDLCVRAGKAGYKLCVADHIYVYHVKSASFGSARRLELAKAGDKMLRSIHSEVDFSSLTRRFMETPSLAYLRTAVRDVYKGLKS